MYVRRGNLVLYSDDHGRTYAFAPETVNAVSPEEPVLDEGYAYVILKSRRGLTYDATEEDLGTARTMPVAGELVNLQLLLVDGRGAVPLVKCTIRIGAAYRENARTTGLLEVELV